MKGFISFTLKYPRSLLFLLFVITILLGDGILKLEFDNSIESMLPKGNEVYRQYVKNKNIYGDNGRILIAAISDDDIWQKAFFEKVDQLHTYLSEYESFDADLENRRLEQFNTVIQSEKCSPRNLIDAFKDDPVFQALLIRKLGEKATLETPLKPKYLNKLKREIEASYSLKKSEPIDFILSPLTAKDISGAGGSLETYSLIEKDENNRRILPETPEEFKMFKKRLRRNPAFQNGIYATDPVTGKITDFGLIIKFRNIEDQTPIAKELLSIMESIKGLKIISTGAPVGMTRFTEYTQRDLFTFLPIVTMVIACVFFLNFRSLRGVLLPFLCVNMAQIWVLGAMGHLGIKITAVGISLPPLMCAVGSSYSIHILNQYYADFNLIREKGLEIGLMHSMTHISMTVLLAALTTFVAFMTLAPTQISAISEWGIASGMGVVFALMISAIMIPACLSLMPHKMPALLMKKNNTVRKTLIDRLISGFIYVSTRQYKTVLLIVFILLSISLAGLLNLQVESSFMTYFKPDDPFRIDNGIMQKKFKGAIGFNILLNSGKEDGIKDPEFLKTVESVRTWLTKDGNEHLNIGRTDAFTDFIKTMHFAVNDDDLSYYKIPDNKLDILDYLELYDGEDDNFDGRPDAFESYIDPAYRICNIVARICPSNNDAPIGTATLERMTHDIETYLKKNLPSAYSFEISGFSSMDIIMSKLTVGSQVQSLLLCLIVIFFIVSFLFSNFKAGLLALIPMSVAVTFNFGIMGWADIRLDMVTSVLAAITIGIGVDDTIHFLNTYKYFREAGHDIDTTIKRTIKVSGKAIIFTSLALVSGFSVLMFSSFNPIILFGLLMALTMTATTIGALLILPAVIKLTGVNLERSPAKYWRYMDLGRIFGLGCAETNI